MAEEPTFALDALSALNEEYGLTEDPDQPQWLHPKPPQLEWDDERGMQYRVSVFNEEDTYRVEGDVWKNYAFERDASEQVEFIELTPSDGSDPVTTDADGLDTALDDVYQQLMALSEADLVDAQLYSLDPEMVAEYPNSMIGHVAGYDAADF